MKLYSYWRSSCSWRVRIALELKGIDYMYVPVHLVKNGGEQHQDSYTAHNPMAQVPTLELSDGTMLTQSIAIIEYLDEQFPNGPALLPRDPLARAKTRSHAELINAGIQPLQNLSVLQALSAMGQDKLAWGRQVIDRGLTALEKLTAPNQTPFLGGAQPTIADLCLVPQLYNARRFKCDLSQYPYLTAVEANCQQLEAFQKAHPDQMPDAQ